MNEEVSVIMPMYNSEKYIKESIESVINQTYTNWKLYIIDDCSMDNSINIVKELEKIDIRIKLIELDENGGPAKSRNRGIKLCKGRYITFIDSDDIWNNDFLEKQLRFIKEKDTAISFSSFERKSEDLKETLGIGKIPLKVNYKQLLKDNCITCLTVLLDTKKIGKKYFNEEHYHEDYIMWLDILKSVKYAYGNQEVLATYRIRNGSMCRNKARAATWRWIIYRKVEKLNLFKSIYYFLMYFIYGVFKSYKFMFMK